ncbi:CG34215, partial [Drosophila busckii]
CVTLLASLALLLLSGAEAAVSQGFFKNDAHPGKCYVKPNLILSAGQSAPYPDMECASINCGSNSLASIHTCGVYGPPPGCKLGPPKHPKANYPDCCEPTFICK